MSAQVTITQLPQAQALTGSESVPIVQNGVTVQTTTGAIAGAGALNYPFLTVGSATGLTNGRYLSTSSGLTLTDNGAGSSLQINLVGAAQSLNSSGNGIQVKTGSNTLTNRSIAVGSGLSVSNADGVAGNPTISLGTLLQQFAGLTGTGILAIQSGSVGKINILGTTSQTSISNGDGSGNITVGLTNTGVTPGTYGSAGQVPVITVDAQGRLTTVSTASIIGGGTVTQIDTGTGLLGGPITGSGTISIDTTVVATLSGSQTLTNKTISGSSNTLTNIGNSSLTNSSITINGTLVSLGGSATISASVSTLTIGTGLSGTSYDGTAPVTIALANTAVTAGNYTYGSFTVNAQGQLTAASNGTAPVTSVGATAPVVSSGGTTPTISMAAANASTSGYLTSTDWNTFNNKQPAGTYVTSVSGTAGRITSTGGTTPVLDLGTTAVSAGSYTYGSFTVDAYGRLTSASSGTAPVTSVSGTSGQITSTGGTTPVLALATTAVSAASYTYASITVDAYGRLTAASSGTSPVTSISFGTTGLTPSTATSGAVTVAGTLATANGGTGTTVGVAGGAF